MIKAWNERAWEEYEYWQKHDKKVLKKINSLVRDIERNGYNCIGKPEPLKGNLNGWWSVHVDDKNRLVFRLSKNNEKTFIEILSCKGHYSDK